MLMNTNHRWILTLTILIAPVCGLCMAEEIAWETAVTVSHDTCYRCI